MDIEDLTAENVLETRKPVSSSVVRIKAKNAAHISGNDPRLPGKQNIHLKVWGCSHNVSDKEYMAGVLQEYGYAIVESDENADLVILVSCTVKNPSESHFFTYMDKLLAQGIKVVAAGCIPQGDAKHTKLSGISIMGVQQIDRIVEVVEQTLLGNTVRLMSQRTRPELDLPKVRKNKYIEIIPINTGCLNACTYCKTKHARGKLGSYTVESITKRIESVISEGVTEIWLTSEDTGAYGRDIKTSISALLEAILRVIERYPHVMLKLGMTNPPYMLEHIDKIVEVLNHPQVFSILHIPVQCGSNKILEIMKREYTVEQFQFIVDALVQNVPGVTVATDIICGFPYETDEDFEETYNLCNKNRFPIMHTTQFYPRPNTPAAKMPKVNSVSVKARTRRLTALFESYDCYSHMVGSTQRVWLTGEIAKDQQHLIGHTKNYVQVLLPNEPFYIGKSVEVKIVGHTRYSIEGIFIDGTVREPSIVGVPRPSRKQNSNACGGDGGCSDCSGGPPSAKDTTTTGKRDTATVYCDSMIPHWAWGMGIVCSVGFIFALGYRLRLSRK
jgi:threonylcarbamoyladenosine tRNA methylthiotransferase CDKAL1